MATQKLVVKRPYSYCRNPVTLGTTAFYLGIAIWTGSLSALGLSLIYPVAMFVYIKLIEEKELEQRFGVQYLEYKRRTPFLLPRFHLTTEKMASLFRILLRNLHPNLRPV